MSNEDLKTMVELLSGTSRFDNLIKIHTENPKDRSFWFEIAFAYWFEKEGYELKYEAKVNPDNDTSVDFYLHHNSADIYFELLRIEHSDEVNKHIKEQTMKNNLFKPCELLLSSDHNKPYFTTSAQIIRLHEKLLEKVAKYPEHKENQLSIIVADCSNIHMGMLDDEDIRIAMYGKSKNPAFQEFWNKTRLIGMFEDEFNFRSSNEFKQKTSAIIFVPKLEPNGLRNALIAINPYWGEVYERYLINELTHLTPLARLSIVKAYNIGGQMGDSKNVIRKITLTLITLIFGIFIAGIVKEMFAFGNHIVIGITVLIILKIWRFF